MENASKALIMAAEILIGIMILSVGVYLFNMFASYSSERYQRIEDIQIDQFNQQFLKFYGDGNDGKPIECTIHDIVSLANLAQKNNMEYDLIEEKLAGENSFQKKTSVDENNSLYVQIDLGVIKHLELKSNDFLVELIKDNDLIDAGISKELKMFKCIVCEPKGDNKKINYVKFVEI